MPSLAPLEAEPAWEEIDQFIGRREVPTQPPQESNDPFRELIEFGNRGIQHNVAALAVVGTQRLSRLALPEDCQGEESKLWVWARP
jgi:hypothetical protein